MSAPARHAGSAEAEVDANERILVVIPTYNDHFHLAGLISAASNALPSSRVLVIDDGSSVPVALVGVGPNVMLFRLPANFGLGVCMHIAFDHALGHGYDAVLRLDADGQHPPEEIPRLMALFRQGHDLVVAERSNGGDANGLRGFLARLVKRYMNFFARILTVGNVPTDLHSGYFVAGQAVMQHLNEQMLQRYPEPQMYILAARNKFSIGTLKIKQSVRTDGVSTLNLMQAARMIYRFNILVLGELLVRRGR